MRLEAKQNEKTWSSPQISRVMVSHHDMMLTQMVSPGPGRIPAHPTPPPQRRHWYYGSKSFQGDSDVLDISANI